MLGAIVALAIAEHSHHHGSGQSSQKVHRDVYYAFDGDTAVLSARTPTVGTALKRRPSWREPRDGASLSFNGALLITLAGALCSCLWSPLATFGTRRDAHNVQSNTFVQQLTFALGQMAAFPSVAIIAGRIGGTGVCRPFRQLTWRAVGWGLLCGLAICSGFLAYFLSSACVSATIIFGIAHCSALVSLLVEVLVMKTFTNATARVKTLLALCGAVYCVAIAVLMLSR